MVVAFPLLSYNALQLRSVFSLLTVCVNCFRGSRLKPTGDVSKLLQENHLGEKSFVTGYLQITWSYQRPGWT